MRNLVNVLLVAILTGFVAQYLGWIAVPVVAIVVSLGARELRLRAWQVGVGAALAWAVSLLWAARSVTFTAVLGSVAGVFQLPAAGLILLALLLPFALGWSTAAVASAIIGRRQDDRTV
jgi:hypothetical protein